MQKTTLQYTSDIGHNEGLSVFKGLSKSVVSLQTHMKWAMAKVNWTLVLIVVNVLIFIFSLCDLLSSRRSYLSDWPTADRKNSLNSTCNPLDSFNLPYNCASKHSKKEAMIPTGHAITGRNIIAIYTGRWKFIRIQLPYVYRELRSNGGVLDEVWFMLVRFDNATISKVREVTQVANRILGKQVFSIHEKGYKKGDYTYPYYEFFSHLTRFPYDRFFKFDDDIVYVQPRAFNHVLQKKDSSKCFMHFFNIAGSNWRCSWLHQKNGVYNETNPQKLKFDYHPNGNCGWKSPECGELAIRTFLHHYKKNQLGIYDFNNLELTSDRKRFSINAFLLDKDLVDIRNMLRVGSIYSDDEKWWTMTLSGRVAHPNCIVGDALVVHFAYNTVVGKLLELGLLDEFAKIVKDNQTSFQVKEELWKILELD